MKQILQVATSACSKRSLEMRIAILTTDNREHYKDYTNPVPHFGTAPEALLQGFALLPELEVHVVSCARARMKSPEKLAPNIIFHSLYVPQLGWMRTLFWGCIQAVRRKLKEVRPDLVFPWLAARLESLTIPRSFGVVCITNYTQQAVTKLA